MTNWCTSPSKRKKVVINRSVFMNMLVTDLQGGEILLLEVKNIIRLINNGSSNPQHIRVVIPLMVNLKGKWKRKFVTAAA